MSKSDKEVQHWRAHPQRGLELVKARMGPCGLGKHFHDGWSLGAILQGECCFQAAGRAHRVASGEIFVIPPFEIHECAAGSDNVMYAVLYVAPATMDALAPAVVAGLAAQPRRVWRQDAVAQDMARAADGEIEIGRIAGWLRALQQEFETGVIDRPGPGRAHPLQAVLERYWAQDLPLAELEMRTGFSRYYTVRTFTRDVGIPPGTYLRQLRALKARRLLRAGQSPAGVAQDLHFADQAHFTRAFKEVHGIPPGSFRRLVRAQRD